MTLFDQQIAEIKISYSHKVKPSNQAKISCSKDAYNFLCPIWPDIDYRENFAILLLSRSNKILGISWTALGGVSGCVVDPRMIFQTALKANASAIILLHNHPSGNPEPSESDKAITRKIKSGGEFLDIAVLDHLILTSETYLSMADDGLM